MSHIKKFESFFESPVDMITLEFELKQAKTNNPKSKVSYYFTKDESKGYRIVIKDKK